MPKCQDIVNQLRAVLPRYTDKFNDSLQITSLSRNGSIVTITTDEDIYTKSKNILSDASKVFISGVRIENPVTNISINGTIATCTVSNIHDLTQGFNQRVKFKGINESGWDNEFILLETPTQYTFTFEIPNGIANPTGTIFLLENRIGFNGYYTITKTSQEQYTYEISLVDESILPTTANIDNASVIYNYRISGASAEENIARFYTEQDIDKLWCFVVLGDVTASKSRKVESDATEKIQQGSNYEQELVSQFNVYIIIPQKTNAISGRILRDEIEDIRIFLFKSILGTQFNSGFVSGEQYLTSFVSDGYVQFNSAYYTHRFTFEVPYFVQSHMYGLFNQTINGDIVEPDDTSAFRFFEIDRPNEFDQLIKITKGELPT